MTVTRALIVLGMMVVIGVAMVAIRGESAKAANRIQKLHQKKVVLGQQLWVTEIELAKLRGPEAIRKRANEMNLDVVPPVVPQSRSAKPGKNKKTIETPDHD